MKRFLVPAVTFLALLAGSAPRAAANGGGPYRIGMNIGCCCYGFTFAFDHSCGRCGSGGGCGPCGGGGGSPGCAPGFGCGPTQLAPWYLYWPHAANFQTPAPMGYPFWPTMNTDAAMYGQGAPVPQQSPFPGVTPVGYFGGSVPSYWYGR